MLKEIPPGYGSLACVGRLKGRLLGKTKAKVVINALFQRAKEISECPSVVLLEQSEKVTLC